MTANPSPTAVEQQPQTVELPPNVRHYKTTAFAETWLAYDALTAEDGWEARCWYVNRRGEPVPVGTPDSHSHEDKQATIRGHHIVVFPPHEPRTTPPVTPAEDEAFRERTDG